MNKNTKDISGQKFGKLTAIKISEKRYKTARCLLWDCVCDCGNTVAVPGTALRKGATKSCGCSRNTEESRGNQAKKRMIDSEVLAINKLIHRYKQSAEKRGYEWNLTFEQVQKIVHKPCKYCNTPPSIHIDTSSKFRGKSELLVSGIDRVDNSKGYVEDNIVPCCSFCNRAKNTLTEQSFFEWVKKVFIAQNMKLP